MEKNKTGKVYYISLVGNRAVGKTSLIRRYFNGDYVEIPYNSSDYNLKNYIKNNDIFKIVVMDMTLSNRFSQLPKQRLAISNGVFFVYSIEDRNSFDSIMEWVDLCKQSNKKGSIITFLLGNKSESLKREVTYEKGETYAKKLGMEFYEVSSKTGKGVMDVFDSLIEKTIDCFNSKEQKLKWVLKMKTKKIRNNNHCQT